MGGAAPCREAPSRPLRQRGCARHRLEGHISFIGSEKRILRRVIREAGVILTPEAQARLDALPEQLLDFVAVPAKTKSTSLLETDDAAQIEAEAA